MKRTLTVLKIFSLVAALAIVAWSAIPSDAEAGVFCETAGHSCHVVIGGHTYHLEEAAVTY